MRKKFVFFALIPGIVILLLLYFFVDSWVAAGIEYAGTKAVGAKVEVDGFHLSVSPIGAELRALRVTDPGDGWKNLVETGRIRFALNFGQLLRSKFIIESMEVNDAVLGTKRTTDGSVPGPKEVSPVLPATVDTNSDGIPDIASPGPKASKKPMFDLAEIRKSLNIDSLVNPNNLASLRMIDSLERQFRSGGVEWDKSLAEFGVSQTKLARIDSAVRSINVKAIKDLPGATNAFNTLKSASGDANAIVGAFRDRKGVLTQSVDGFGSSIRAIDDVVQQDYQHALHAARLPDLSMNGLAEAVLGKDVVRRAYTYLGYAQFVKEKTPAFSSKPPLETPERLRGQNIHFPQEHSYPKFWIRKMLLSGGTDRKQDTNYFYATGEILNVSNDQHLTGQPITAHLAMTRGGTTSLDLKATIDRRTEVGVDTYDARLTGLAIGSISLGSSDLMPARATHVIADAVATVQLPGSELESSAAIAFRNMAVSFDREPKSTIERIVHDVLAPTSAFHVRLRAWKKGGGPFDISFTTDLDEMLAARTKQVLGEELTKIQNDVKAKIDAQIASKRAQLEKAYGAKRDEVMAKVRVLEAQYSDKLAAIEAKKKELESRVNAEQKKQTEDAKKKAGDAVKKLFK
jgi:uncharacterized protein (TIGR03545 family)